MINGLWILLAGGITTAVLPPLISFSWRIGALDVPGEARRIHQASVPRTGGIAIFLSYMATALFSGLAGREMQFTLFGAAIVFAIGLADDLFGLPAWGKFFFQLLAAMVAVGGSSIKSWGGAFAALFWVLLLTNAHNLIDGMDGLLAGTAIAESAGLAAMLFLTGSSAFFPLLLLACCISFYGFNRNPAKTFAGDCGSGTVGFLLAMLSLPLFARQSWMPAFLAPVLLFSYPITEVFTTILRRFIRQKPLFTADRGHLHHLLYDLGIPAPECVRLLNAVCASFAVLAALLMREEYAAYTAVISLLCIAVLLFARRFVFLRSKRKNIAQGVDFSAKI